MLSVGVGGAAPRTFAPGGKNPRAAIGSPHENANEKPSMEV